LPSNGGSDSVEQRWAGFDAVRHPLSDFYQPCDSYCTAVKDW